MSDTKIRSMNLYNRRLFQGDLAVYKTGILAGSAAAVIAAWFEKPAQNNFIAVSLLSTMALTSGILSGKLCDNLKDANSDIYGQRINNENIYKKLHYGVMFLNGAMVGTAATVGFYSNDKPLMEGMLAGSILYTGLFIPYMYLKCNLFVNANQIFFEKYDSEESYEELKHQLTKKR